MVRRVGEGRTRKSICGLCWTDSQTFVFSSKQLWLIWTFASDRFWSADCLPSDLLSSVGTLPGLGSKTLWLQCYQYQRERWPDYDSPTQVVMNQGTPFSSFVCWNRECTLQPPAVLLRFILQHGCQRVFCITCFWKFWKYPPIFESTGSFCLPLQSEVGNLQQTQ